MKYIKGLFFLFIGSLVLSLLGCSKGFNADIDYVGKPICVLNESYDSDDITAIMVSYHKSGNSIVLKQSSDGKIHIKEFLNSNRSNLEAAKTDFQNKTLTISGTNSKFKHFSANSDYLEIMLPTDFVGRLKLQTTSGAVTAKYLYQINLTIITTSGFVCIDDLNGNVNFESTSGGITIAGGNFFGSFFTNSGSIDLKIDDLSGDISATTTSGSVNISVPNNASFVYKMTSTSGRTISEFGGTSGSLNGGNHNLSLSTDSGIVRLKKG